MTSLFLELDGRDVILNVAKDQVKILEPTSPQSAISTRGVCGRSFLVLMGTAPGSAIILANLESSKPHTCTPGIFAGVVQDYAPNLGGDEHYMSLVRKTALMLIKEPEMFQLPVAYLIIDPHQKGESLLSPLADRTVKVLKHLHVDTKVSFYEKSWPEVVGISSESQTILAVRHKDGPSEIYLGNCLVFPE